MGLKYLLFTLFVLSAGIVQANTYPEVIFDNSNIPGSYAKSHVHYEGNSWVQNLNNNLLVSDSVFFTPGNALSLRYTSGYDGDWSARLFYSKQKFNYNISKGYVLSLKVYVQSENTSIDDLPQILISQSDTLSRPVKLNRFVDDYQVASWLEIKIPVSQFQGIDVQNAISGIVFKQNRPGDSEHHIFVDQVEFLPAKYPQVKLSSPAVLSGLTPYGNHVHLQWQLPLTPSIRYVKIYRSEDNAHFDPIAIRPIYMQGALDYVPSLDKKYYYKIAWVDYDYKESPFSAVRDVETKKITDEQLLDLIQLAHVNYFVENYEVNSGMHLPFRIQDKSIVSTKETGHALLSMLVGVERGYVSKSIFVDRISRIVDFLENIPNRYGIMATYYDARERLPEYLDDKPSYSVEATTSLIEALLVVRQYLSADSPRESAAREKITRLWDNIAWPSLLLEGHVDVLRADVSMVDELNNIRPLGGFNESMSAYLLAAASTKNNIPADGFWSNVISEYGFPKVVPADSLQTDSLQQLGQWEEQVTKDAQQLADTLQRLSIEHDTIVYGIRVPFGEPSDKTLLTLYRPFMTLHPYTANTAKYRFADILANYKKVHKRRDNEIRSSIPNDNLWGYQLYGNNTYRINPAISISSIFLDQAEGLRAIRSLYSQFGEVLFSEYGFRSWIDIAKYDVADGYSSENHSAIVVMIENARSGLIWKLYNDIPEIKSVKQKLFAGNTLK